MIMSANHTGRQRFSSAWAAILGFGYHASEGAAESDSQRVGELMVEDLSALPDELRRGAAQDALITLNPVWISTAIERISLPQENGSLGLILARYANRTA